MNKKNDNLYSDSEIGVSTRSVSTRVEQAIPGPRLRLFQDSALASEVACCWHVPQWLKPYHFGSRDALMESAAACSTLLDTVLVGYINAGIA